MVILILPTKVSIGHLAARFFFGPKKNAASRSEDSRFKGICTGGDETRQGGGPPWRITSDFFESGITLAVLNGFGLGVAQNEARDQGVHF